MSKKFKLLTGLLPVTLSPIIVASCTNNSTEDQKKESVNLTDDQKKELILKQINELKKEDQLSLVKKLNLTADEKAEIIASLNSGAGLASAIVWYMKSTESRMASLQAYTLAKTAFDNLKKRADVDNFDYTKVNKETGVVSNPDSGKAIPVVFMDIDETVFINEYSEVTLVTDKNGRFSETDKEAVDAKGQRRAIPGAIDFIKHVFDNGGIVLFNSGIRQLEASVNGIKKNLIAAGLPEKYVHDWMFWTAGVKPLKDDNTFDTTPWRTAINGYKNGENLKRVTSKNQRMNAVSDNQETGWDFSEAQTGAGNKIIAKVIMRIGDDFNDFYDDAYKSYKSNEKSTEFSKKEEVNALFTNPNGAQGIKVALNGKDYSIEKLNWYQFNVQVPGNSMYGGWSAEFSHGAFSDLWDALKEIKKESNDNK